MPRRAFKKMWEDLQSSGRWEGVVKNMRTDTGYYWVYAIISGVYKEGKLVEYKSLRKPISNEQKIEFQKKYDQMRNIDKDNIRTVVYKD
jgi:aerotaxis receptor